MTPTQWSRRRFIQRSLAVTAGAPLALAGNQIGALAQPQAGSALQASLPSSRSRAVVGVVPCRSYGPEVRGALRRCFDLLGGIGSLVKEKTVTVKLNLTGTDFSAFLGRPVGETFMTHYATAAALGSLLFEAGARRVRYVESTVSRADLAASLALADWDLKALEALGNVEFENTRNLGHSKRYCHLRVPGGGYLFSALDLNQAYGETDVMISLAKLKQHVTAGVTLTMKNLFGITPNALYGDEAGREDAVAGREVLHNPRSHAGIKLPGLKEGVVSTDPTWRVPRIIVDICAARPIDLAIIDGITAMSGGEGPWCGDANSLKPTSPGVLVAGLNAVSTDAVGTAIMGFDNPLARRGTRPFDICDNHLALAEQVGLGTADLSRIEIRGLGLDVARCPYR